MKYTYKKMAGGGSVKSGKGYTAKDRKAIRSLIEELADPHSVDVTGGSSVTVIKKSKKRMAGGGAADAGQASNRAGTPKTSQSSNRSINVSPSPRERSTPQSATGKSVGYGGRKPGPSSISRPQPAGGGAGPTQAKTNLPAAFGGPSRTNNSIAAGIARAGRSLGDAVGSAQRGSRGYAAGGIVGRPASSYRDMKAGAGSGVGRIQKTKIARGR